MYCIKRISIHAPAKGATSASQCHRCARPAISIHAPAKGATDFNSTIFKSKRHFNPRSRKGSDDTVKRSELFRDYFNPRSRKGSDLWIIRIRIKYRSISIHAPAKGATIISYHSRKTRQHFNPRSRKGSD